MKKIISILLLITMSFNLLAETASKVASSVEVNKEVSGINKSKAEEDRILLESEEKSPIVEKVEINLGENLDNSTIEYGEKNNDDELFANVNQKKTKPNYVVWGIGILGVLVAGLALNSN